MSPMESDRDSRKTEAHLGNIIELKMGPLWSGPLQQIQDPMQKPKKKQAK